MRVVEEILQPFDIIHIVEGIKNHIHDYFEEFDVFVSEIPDLTRPPYYLAAPGLCGYTKLLDVGSQDYLTPLPQLNKSYDLKSISTLIDMPDAFFIGAGAGPYQSLNTNSELVANIKFDAKHVIQKNHSYTVKCLEQKMNELPFQVESLKTSSFSILGNFLVSKGSPGKGIKIVVSKSKMPHETNFLGIIKKCLQQADPHTPIALGGAFVLRSGKAKIHIMPDFPNEPIDTTEKLMDWLHFYEIPAPITCLGTLISHDIKDLALRLEHAHCFATSLTGENFDRENVKYGGHYHCDTVPSESCYEAYFVPCQTVCRLDQPSTEEDDISQK